jgi:two-component system, OmpR family, sensor histidine kinase BaeS
VCNSLSAEAESRQVSFKIDASSDLPLALVDPLRIREVLVNLLSNALHHTPADGVVSIAAKTTNDVYEISVADTGSGIAAEELAKIFDRFYKDSASRGSGLGLTIARNLVIAHAGAMRAASRPGQGTSVTFTLPLSAI